MELKDRTTIVTGAGSGIGRAIALEFGRQGANVVCAARRANLLDETVSLIEQEGGRALAVPTDLIQRDQVNALIGKTLDSFGRIDVVFNNAGSFAAIGAVWEVHPDAWWHDVTVNLLGPMLVCRAVLPHMMARDEGIIINMNGGGSTGPLTGGSGYGCSKAGLLRLTDTLAAELEKEGSHVLVLAMGPGLVQTEMTQLQVDDPLGVKWIPSTKESLAKGNHRPPEDCARDTVKLIRIACPELNGRIFGAGDDFDQIARDAAEIKASDKRVMRGR